MMSYVYPLSGVEENMPTCFSTGFINAFILDIATIVSVNNNSFKRRIMAIKSSTKNKIMVVTISSPPVNAFSSSDLKEMNDLIENASFENPKDVRVKTGGAVREEVRVEDSSFGEWRCCG